MGMEYDRGFIIWSDKKELLRALCKAKMGFKPIVPTGINTYYNNAIFATFNDMVIATSPSLLENGLDCHFYHRCDVNTGLVFLIMSLTHAESGQYIESAFPLANLVSRMPNWESLVERYLGIMPQTPRDGEKEKKKIRITIQEVGSEITYGKRYLYGSVLGLSVSGAEDDGNIASGLDNEKKTTLTGTTKNKGKTTKPAATTTGTDPQSINAMKKLAVIFGKKLGLTEADLVKQAISHFKVLEPELVATNWSQIVESLKKRDQQVALAVKALGMPQAKLATFVINSTTWADFAPVLKKLSDGDADTIKTVKEQIESWFKTNAENAKNGQKDVSNGKETGAQTA